MSKISRKNAIDHLRKLQKRLIINDTSAQAMYTKFNDRSSKIFDLHRLSEYEPNYLSILFHGKHLIIETREPNDQLAKNLIQHLRKIINSNQTKVKDLNVDALYLGYPYIIGTSGKIEKEEDASQVFRAPLILWKINLEIIGPTKLKLWLDIDNENLKVNMSLLARLLVINKKTFDLNSVRLLFTSENFVEDVLKIYETCGCHFLKDEKARFVDAFKNRKSTKFINPQAGRQELLKSVDKTSDTLNVFAVLGIFAYGNESLYNLYEEMISKDGPEFYQELNDRFSEGLEQKEEFKENQLMQVTPLDYSQKMAISYALKGDLVIQGPPGTGKSQVITNIIANAIQKNKTVLFVTEKYVAAEVVHNRLNKISRFALPIFDIANNSKKDNFYKKIENSLMNIESPEFSKNHSSDEIEAKFQQILEYKNFSATKESKNWLLFLQENYKKFDDFNEWRCDIKSLLKFKNTSDFNDYIETFKLNKEAYQKFLPIIKNNHLDADCTEKLYYVNTFFIDKESFNHDDLAFYLVKNKIKEKYNFLNKFTIKRMLKKQKYLPIFNFFKNASTSTRELFLSFNQETFWHFHDAINSATTKETNLFLRKYDHKFFDYEKLLKFIEFEKFEQTNAEMLATVNVDFNSEIKNLMSTKLINDNKEILKNYLGNLYRILSKDNEAQKQRSDLLNHSKGTRKRKIQWAIKRYEKAINLFFPVIISSPNDVAAIFNHKRFDYVVIDEASQVTLERALPILYLGNTRIISGDKQQLQPTDFFQSKLKEEYEETYSDDDASVINDTSDIQDSNSLLEYVEKKYHIEMLTYHYRSSKRELIQFSNVVFYDGQLVVVNSPKDNKPGIEIVDVNGLWDGKTNIFEAKKIVEKIKSICSKPHHGSIGVITFNINQKNLIDTLIEQENDANINKELNRKKENGEDESLFVKNLENVQGDERDIIIFSLTYAKQGDGSFRQRFGPINQKAGENRINVAVSRAKNKIYIFKSIKASSIARAGQSKGRQVFHDYVEYVELFAKSNDLESKEIKSLFNRYLNTSEEKNDIEQTHRFDSPFEEDVYHEIFNKLDTKKYKIETQIQQSGYRIDLAIKELKTGNFVLAIECDGHQYHHANQMQKDNDFYRQNYLENRGWAFYRIDSWKWYRSDRNKIVQEILKKLL